ncbi:DUF1127 domain-containing protein [Pseudomonas sp. LRF_L74]|uniref:DUF1127 domain-containing protein n=1 Tax=Pseudomonas sp. LRF_L74 TaxID=3369422 RepID=UPI003F632AAC
MERTLGSDLIFQENSKSSGSLLLRAVATLLTWQRRVISRRELARLDERLLKDAGISLYEREREIAKPFWE